MAEALAVVGVVTSIIQLADYGFRLSVKLLSYSEAVSRANKSIHNLSDEVSSMSAVLKVFSEILQEDEAKYISRAAVEATQRTIKECFGVFEGLTDILEKALPSDEEVHKKDSGGVRRMTLGERMKWPFLQPRAELLRAHLDRLKMSLMLMLEVLRYAKHVAKRKREQSLAHQKTVIENLSRKENEATRKYRELQMLIECRERQVTSFMVNEALPSNIPPNIDMTIPDGEDRSKPHIGELILLFNLIQNLLNVHISSVSSLLQYNAYVQLRKASESAYKAELDGLQRDHGKAAFRIGAEAARNAIHLQMSLRKLAARHQSLVAAGVAAVRQGVPTGHNVQLSDSSMELDARTRPVELKFIPQTMSHVLMESSETTSKPKQTIDTEIAREFKGQNELDRIIGIGEMEKVSNHNISSSINRPVMPALISTLSSQRIEFTDVSQAHRSTRRSSTATLLSDRASIGVSMPPTPIPVPSVGRQPTSSSYRSRTTTKESLDAIQRFATPESGMSQINSILETLPTGYSYRLSTHHHVTRPQVTSPVNPVNNYCSTSEIISWLKSDELPYDSAIEIPPLVKTVRCVSRVPQGRRPSMVGLNLPNEPPIKEGETSKNYSQKKKNGFSLGDQILLHYMSPDRPDIAEEGGRKVLPPLPSNSISTPIDVKSGDSSKRENSWTAQTEQPLGHEDTAKDMDVLVGEMNVTGPAGIPQNNLDELNISRFVIRRSNSPVSFCQQCRNSQTACDGKTPCGPCEKSGSFGECSYQPNVTHKADVTLAAQSRNSDEVILINNEMPNLAFTGSKGVKGRGRKRKLSARERESSAYMRKIGVCRACTIRKLSCDAGNPCLRCIKHWGPDLPNHPCRPNVDAQDTAESVLNVAGLGTPAAGDRASNRSHDQESSLSGSKNSSGQNHAEFSHKEHGMVFGSQDSVDLGGFSTLDSRSVHNAPHKEAAAEQQFMEDRPSDLVRGLLTQWTTISADDIEKLVTRWP